MQFFSSTLFALVILFPLWRIFDRAGLNPWLALLALIPWLGPIVVLAILAFARWPRVEGPGGAL